jgi:hypothetical protein
MRRSGTKLKLIHTSPTQWREGDRPPKSGGWRGQANAPNLCHMPLYLPACPLHHALCGARSPSRRYAGEVSNRNVIGIPPWGRIDTRISGRTL